MRSPAIPLAAAFIAGLFTSNSLGLHPALSGALALTLLCACLAFARREHLLVASAFVVLGYVLLGSAAGGLLRHRAEGSPLLVTFHRLGESRFESPARIEGRLRREPEFRDLAVLTVDCDRIRVGRETYAAGGGIRARVGGELLERLDPLSASDRVMFWGKLDEPLFFRNEGGFDGKSWLQRERVDLFASVKSALLVESNEGPFRAAAWVSRLRRKANESIHATLEAGGDPSREVTAGVVTALVTGERARLSPDIEKLYRDAGIFHVMAISGSQVAVVALVFYFLMRRLGAGEVGTLWALLFLLPVYAAFCGSGPPVVRAAFAAAIVLGARLLSLDRPHVNALAIAALVLLAWQPAWLEDPGFQLSFAAMAAILWLTEPLAKRFGRLGPLAKPLAISVAAQVVVIPITAWHFHGFTWVAPLSSLVAVPLSGLIVILGLLIVLFGGVPFLSSLLAALAHLGVSLLTASAKVASELPAATLAVARPSVPWMVSYYGALIAIRHGPRGVRTSGLLGVALLLAKLILGPLPPSPDGDLSLTALDVGHGDALVLTLPEGPRALIDGGGLPASSFDVGERVVLPYLLDHGGPKLDVVVATHTDFDHLSGLIPIVDSMSVKEIWEGAPRWERALYRRFRETARRRGIPVRRLRAGESFDWGGALWEVLAADGVGANGAALSENDRSIVLRVTSGQSRMLLMGDAGREIESELLRRGASLEADVLKVGHHGSKSGTSEAFLEAVQPELAIVSGRRSSGWPLPSPEVLERLRASGIAYARTDEEGAITVRLKPEGGFEVTTYQKGNKRRGAEAQRRRE